MELLSQHLKKAHQVKEDPEPLTAEVGHENNFVRTFIFDTDALEKSRCFYLPGIFNLVQYFLVWLHGL
jgi:hypothetical protein